MINPFSKIEDIIFKYACLIIDTSSIQDNQIKKKMMKILKFYSQKHSKQIK